MLPMGLIIPNFMFRLQLLGKKDILIRSESNAS